MKQPQNQRCGAGSGVKPDFRSERDAGHKKTEIAKPDYSPYPDQKFPNRVYWGVAHVHTGYSFDSGMFGERGRPFFTHHGCTPRLSVQIRNLRRLRRCVLGFLQGSVV